MKKFLILILCIFTIAIGAQAQQTEVKVKINVGPQDRSVYERNLVDNEPLASDIIAESGAYYKETSLKNFNGTVLGYVTPVSFIDFSLATFYQRNQFLVEFTRLRHSQDIRPKIQHHLPSLASDRT